MECNVCNTSYDDENKKPISFYPCGHTCCLDCFKRLDERPCPICRSEIICSQVNLGVLQIITSHLKQPQSSAKEPTPPLKLPQDILQELNESEDLCRALAIRVEINETVRNEKFKELRQKIQYKTNEIIRKLLDQREKFLNQTKFIEDEYNRELEIIRIQKTFLDSKLNEIKANLLSSTANYELDLTNLKQLKQDLNFEITKINKLKIVHDFKSNSRVDELDFGKLEKNLDTLPRVGPHTEKINALAVLSTNNIVSASSDTTVKIWDSNIGENLKTLEGHTSSVWALCVLSNDNIVSGSGDGTVIVWNSQTGDLIKILVKHTCFVYSLARLSNDNIVCGFEDNTIQVWNSKTSKLVRNLEGHTWSVNALAVLENDFIVSGAGYPDNSIRIWNSANGQLVHTLVGHTKGVYALAVLSNSNIVSGGSNGEVKIWDSRIGSLMKSLEVNTKHVNALVVAGEDKIVNGTWDHTIQIWKSGELSKTLEGHTDHVLALAVLHNNNRNIVSASWDKTIRIWDSSSGSLIKTF